MATNDLFIRTQRRINGQCELCGKQIQDKDSLVPEWIYCDECFASSQSQNKYGDCWISWNELGGYEILTTRNGMTCSAGPDDEGFVAAVGAADEQMLLQKYVDNAEID